MKLRLKLDDLQVDSFSVHSQPARMGTVKGHATDFASCAGGTSCNCPTEVHCIYPSTSCGDTRTFGEYTCFCLYPNTDARVCCEGGSGPGQMC